MIIDCIADLHGNYPDLEGGDLLIVAGDLTAGDAFPEYVGFFNWLRRQRYRRKVLVAGNHDNHLLRLYTIPEEETDLSYLCDSGTEFEGLKIWGSPWTKSFPGMNPHCKAFTLDTEEELAEKWALIPDDTDILITHSPPYGILDRVDFSEDDSSAINVGSTSLAKFVGARVKPPRFWIWGHIHESYGFKTSFLTQYVNASHVNGHYQPVNKPIRIEL